MNFTNVFEIMDDKIIVLMCNIIDVSLRKADAMNTIKVKYAWLYPHITNDVWNTYYKIYLNRKNIENNTLIEDEMQYAALIDMLHS